MNDQDAWQTCPPGTLRRMVDRLVALDAEAEAREQAQNAIRSLPLLACGLLVVGAIALAMSTNRFGGVSCSQCQEYFAAFHQHLSAAESGELVVELDAKQLRSVNIHLAKCEICRAKFERQYPDTPLPPPLTERQSEPGSLASL